MTQSHIRYLTRVHYTDGEAAPLTRMNSSYEEANAYFQQACKKMEENNGLWLEHNKIEVFRQEAVFESEDFFYSKLALLESWTRPVGKPIVEYNKPVKEKV